MENTKQDILAEVSTQLSVPGFKVRVTGRETWRQIGIYSSKGGVVPGTQVMFYDNNRPRKVGEIAGLFDEKVRAFNESQNEFTPQHRVGVASALEALDGDGTIVRAGNSEVKLSLSADGMFTVTTTERGLSAKNLLDYLAKLKQSVAY